MFFAKVRSDGICKSEGKEIQAKIVYYGPGRGDKTQ